MIFNVIWDDIVQCYKDTALHCFEDSAASCELLVLHQQGRRVASCHVQEAGGLLAPVGIEELDDDFI